LGVVVIGLGTSAPEFLVSGVAAARGDIGIAVGNIVGSNILNLTLILGVAGMIGTVVVTSRVIRREVPLAAASVVLFAIMVWIGLNPITGTVLAATTIAALWLLVRWATHGRDARLTAQVADYTDNHDVLDTAPSEGLPPAPSRRSAEAPSWWESVRALIGLAGVLAGAELLVANVSTVATDLGVSQIVIGFTVVALGTSLPELVTTIAAMRRKENDLVVGNLFGSNLFNSLAGGAVVAFANVQRAAARPSVAMLVTMILTAWLAWALLRRGLSLSRAEAGFLLAIYALTAPVLLST
jgi:cation:H+ antiporter